MKRQTSFDTGPWTAAVALAIWALALWMLYHGPAGTPAIPPDGLLWAAPFVGCAVIGGLIAGQKPGNRIGWLLLGVGLLQGLGLFGSVMLRFLYVLGASSVWVGWLELLPQSLSPITYGLLAAVLLVFPDGKLLSARWTWAGAVVAVFALLGVADAVVNPYPPLPGGLPISPLANRQAAQVLDVASSFEATALVYLLVASSLPLRYMRGGVRTREQIKWFGAAVGLLVVCSLVRGVAGDFVPHGEGTQTVWLVTGTAIQTAGLLGVPIAIGIAILRHRLFDIDQIISRAITYGVMVVIATAFYVALAVAAGAILGRTAGTNLLVAVVATAILAVAFQPMRLRLIASANRIVYGNRQAPYEAMTNFTRQLAGSYSVEDVLVRMVEVLAQGLRCRAAAVLVVENSREAVRASWPSGSLPPSETPGRVVPVMHQGHRHGSLAVWTHPGEELSPTEEHLMSDLATQAGSVLHNASLTVELRRKLEELQASRRRVVIAQDSERRRVERDLHDGAQADLVRLRMKLGLLESAARTDNPKLAGVLGELRDETAATLETIRSISRGVYSPLLESQGLAAALTAQARRLPIPVEVVVCDRRFPPEVETAVYFCCSEALQNAAKHSRATRARICVGVQNGDLRFDVDDDGCGFVPSHAGLGSGLQNIRDRVDALEGTVVIDSTSVGTSVRGSIPITDSADRKT